MRRVGQGLSLAVVASLAVSKRYARRRQLRHESENEDKALNAPSTSPASSQHDARPDVSSLRSEGMMAAPATTSLDNIRSQLALMRSENARQKAAEQAAREHQRWLEEQRAKQMHGGAYAGTQSQSQNERLTDLIKQEFARLHKPNDVFFNGTEIKNGVAQRTFLLLQRRLRDADEVLRKRGGKKDTERFVRYAFGSSPQQSSKLIAVLQSMRAKWTVECKRLASTVQLRSGRGDAETLANLSWVHVLEGLPDEDVRLLWDAGVLDADTIASLFCEPREEHAHESEGEVGEDDNGASSAGLLLDEKIEYIERLQHLQELTSDICQTELGGVPSIDLAPTVAKVQRQQFNDITEEELRALERYEEAAAMRVSANGISTSEGTSAAPDVSGPKASRSTVAFDVPAATLDRALTPSNTFLSAVAAKHPPLQRSLEALERIKREALLDPEFQEAVRFAHAVEEASVAPHIHGVPLAGEGARSSVSGQRSGGDGDGEESAAGGAGPRRVLSKRERRAARSRQFRGPMARSPYAPEVVPYYYNDVRSIVPPRGAFNLPDPTPTKAERAQLRGQRRRAERRSRYRK